MSADGGSMQIRQGMLRLRSAISRVSVSALGHQREGRRADVLMSQGRPPNLPACLPA